jgi:uncharacterized RDD family membrane protein YckC
MSGTAESPESDPARQTTLEENVPSVGLMTRVLSWAVDLLLINLVAIITGLGAQLIASIFPITKNLKPLLVAIAGAVYILWMAAYFVAFWSVTGQTLGSRLMQIRLVTASGDKVKPVRALMGFPDWLAHTRVIEVQQVSIAAARGERLLNARDGSGKRLLRSRGSPIRVSPRRHDSREER